MSNDIENQKAKIRERYKGKLLDDVEIIPALPQPKLYDDNRVKRVAAYARVSTIDINQTTSYELQKNHFLVYSNDNFVISYKTHLNLIIVHLNIVLISY